MRRVTRASTCCWPTVIRSGTPRTAPTSSRASCHPASMASPTNSSTHPGRNSCGCGRVSKAARRSRSPAIRAALAADLFAMLADRETAPPDTSAARRPFAGMGAQAVRAVRAGSGLWHALLDGTDGIETRHAANHRAPLRCRGRATGQSEHSAERRRRTLTASRMRAEPARAGGTLIRIPQPSRPKAVSCRPCISNIARALAASRCSRSPWRSSRLRRMPMCRSKSAASAKTSAPTCSPIYRSSATRIPTTFRRSSSSACRSAANARCAAHCGPSASTNPRSPPR